MRVENRPWQFGSILRESQPNLSSELGGHHFRRNIAHCQRSVLQYFTERVNLGLEAMPHILM